MIAKKERGTDGQKNKLGEEKKEEKTKRRGGGRIERGDIVKDSVGRELSSFFYHKRGLELTFCLFCLPSSTCTLLRPWYLIDTTLSVYQTIARRLVINALRYV